MALLLAGSSAQAETVLTVEDPAADSDISGIGLIAGWAVSDVGIESVEILIDGESIGFAPYGGTRQDVGNAFPHIPNAAASGWAMKWNYGNQTAGSHQLTVIATDLDGRQTARSVEYRVSEFRSGFIADPNDVSLAAASLVPDGNGGIMVLGATVEGETVDLLLRWDTASQQFRIVEIHYPTPPVAVEPAPNRPPSVHAGSDRLVRGGEPVNLSGRASDSDGHIVEWRWTQVSGPSANLSGAATRTLGFTAPNQDATLMFELTVTDDIGASASDRVIVTVQAPDPLPTTVSSTTLQAMVAELNAVRAIGRQCGDRWYDAVPAVTWDTSLAEAAREHAIDMAANGFFSHTSSDGTPWNARVFRYWRGRIAGENLYAANVDRNAQMVVEGWLNSPGHCANLMEPEFTHVGVAKAWNPALASDIKYFWALDFGG